MKGKNNKPKTGMSRLLELAATKKPLMISSIILSSLASVASFIPYLAIYYIVKNILDVWPDSSAMNISLLISYGWVAFGGVALNIVLYFSALVCSHLAAFGTLYDLKINFATHLAKVPLGFHVMIGSGKLRKIMDENIEKIEGFIAHQLPDIVAAFVAPVVIIAILLGIDWRFGLAAMIAVVIAFVVQISVYGNEGAQKRVTEYQQKIEEMNNASVEYIRGISVVKAFKQTVYSFRRLHETIKEYTRITLDYTFSWENTFSIFMSLINNIYLFILPVGIFIGMNTNDFTGFASKLIFYFIFVPSIAGILTKVMYVNSNSMRIIHGVEAMDSIFAEPVLAQPDTPKIISNYSIEFRNVSFSYDKDRETEALSGVSFFANQNEVTAIVGPSGGGKSTIAHLIPRFFDVTDGAILIGGADIRSMNSSYLMDMVSFVFQDVFLVKQSIRDNIRMGNTNATDKEIEDAAKAAQCHEFITKLKHGYDNVMRAVATTGGVEEWIYDDLESTYVADDEMRKRMGGNNSCAYMKILEQMHGILRTRLLESERGAIRTNP